MISHFGNALLLGQINRQLTRKKYGSFSDSISIYSVVHGSDPKPLRNALVAAGRLDEKLSRLPEAGLQNLLRGGGGQEELIAELFAQKADIATATLEDFGSEWIKATPELSEVYEAAKPDQLSGPIALLPPTKFLTLAAELVVEQLILAACDDLGVTPQVYEFIGIDGLLTQRTLLSPPRWSQWNSAAAKQVRREQGWLDDLLRKADRHLWQPISRTYRDKEIPTEVEADDTLLGITEDQIVAGLAFDRLYDLGAHMAEKAGFNVVKQEELFPSYGAMSKYRNYLADADPFNVLTYAQGLIGLKAVLRNWAVCITEDGLHQRFPTLVEPASVHFPELDDALPRPEVIGAESCFDVDKVLLERLGAERAFFVLRSSAVSKRIAEPLVHGKQVSTSRLSQNTGFDETDAPFVSEGVLMVQTLVAKSANQAAHMLVDKYGVVRPHEMSPGSKAILSNSPDNAQQRLGKKIRAAMKGTS